MSEVCQVFKSDKVAMKQVCDLLQSQGIRLDDNIDYVCAIYKDNTIVATGSIFKNTIRCTAVSEQCKGEGLLNSIITHLIDRLYNLGIDHIFVCTKPEAATFFSSLGFYEISSVKNVMVFMENKPNGFNSYLKSLNSSMGSIARTKEDRTSAIIMNANPCTNGHLSLIKKASKESDIVHLFLVSENESIFPYEVRCKLVTEAVKDIDNVIIHETGPYMISLATFPSYFLKDQNEVTSSHAYLDAQVFVKIADYLNINTRYVGSEPFSLATNIYNEALKNTLSKNNIALKVIERYEHENEAISASKVRQLIKSNNTTEIEKLVPEPTYRYIRSNDSVDVVNKILHAECVVHH